LRPLYLTLLAIGILTGVCPAGAVDLTGVAIGVSGGWVSGNSAQTDPGVPCSFFGTCPVAPPVFIEPSDGSYHMGGGLFGGGLTYNFWQAGPWVLGIAGDYSDANVSGSFSSCGAGSPLPHPCGTALQSLATVRGNVGYNLVGSWLVYATGGYAGGNVHAWDALAGGSGTKFLSGWSAGAGVQTLLTPNLALKFEYLHTDLGSAGLFNVVPGVMETVSFSGDIFRVGLDWRFGYYAPASAKQIYTK
jgi:outer membrane immunogenic protein